MKEERNKENKEKGECGDLASPVTILKAALILGHKNWDLLWLGQVQRKACLSLVSAAAMWHFESTASTEERSVNDNNNKTAPTLLCPPLASPWTVSVSPESHPNLFFGSGLVPLGPSPHFTSLLGIFILSSSSQTDSTHCPWHTLLPSAPPSRHPQLVPRQAMLQGLEALLPHYLP